MLYFDIGNNCKGVMSQYALQESTPQVKFREILEVSGYMPWRICDVCILDYKHLETFGL